MSEALLLNLSIVGYHSLFPDAPPHGWLIASGSLLVTLSVGASGWIPVKWLRVPPAVLSTWAAIAGTWLLHLQTTLDPLLIYEYGTPLPSVLLLAAITALLIGAFAHMPDLHPHAPPGSVEL